MAGGPAFGSCLATAEEPGGSSGVGDRGNGLIHFGGCGLAPQAQPQGGFGFSARATDRLKYVGGRSVAAGGATAAGQVRAQGLMQVIPLWRHEIWRSDDNLTHTPSIFVKAVALFAFIWIENTRI